MNMISTGSFLTETGASNKQSELVKKLTAAWEKKNSKTARAGGASLMALSLAACGGEDTTPFAQSDVDAAVAAAEAPLQEAVAAAEAAQAAAEADAAEALVAQAAAEADAAEALVAQAAAEADAAAALVAQAAAEADAAAALVAQSAAEADAAAATVAAAEATAAKEAAEAAQAAAEASLATAQADLTAKTAEYDALVASNATLQGQYDALVAPKSLALTSPATDNLIGGPGNDTFTGAGNAIDAADKITDQSTTDADVLTLSADANSLADPGAGALNGVQTVGGGAITVSNVETINIEIASLTANVGIDTDNISGNQLLSISRVDPVVAGATLNSGGRVTIENVNAANTPVIEITGTEVTRADAVFEAATQDGATFNFDTVTTTVNMTDGAGTLNAAAATGTVTADDQAATVNTTAVTVNAAAATTVNVGQAQAYDGNVTVNAASATTVAVNTTTGVTTVTAPKTTSMTVDDAAGGGTITAATTSTADSTITVSDIDASGFTINTGTGSTTAAEKQITIELDGTTAATDVATINGTGSITVDILQNANQQIDSLNLSGADGAATYILQDAADVLAAATVTGSNAVSISSDSQSVSGASITGLSTLTLTANSNANATIDLDSVTDVSVIVTADMDADGAGDDILRLDAGSSIEFRNNQTVTTINLDTATSDLSLVAGDVNGTTTTVGTLDFGTELTTSQASANGATTGNTTGGTVTLTANESNVTVAGVTAWSQNLVLVGDENVTLSTAGAGTSVKAASLNAAALTGNLTVNVEDNSNVADVTSVTSGSGTDNITMDVGTAVVSVDAGAGNDTIVVTDTGDTSTFSGNEGDDTFTMTESATSYVVIGGAGNDSFNTGTNTAMNATIVGGEGSDDTLIVGNAALDLTASSANFAISGVEVFELDALGNTMTMTSTQFANNNTVKLEGAGGDDLFVVEGVATGATIDASNLTVEATQAVTITYSGGTKADTITGGAANETLDFGSTAGGAGGVDTYDGGAGTDTFDGADIKGVTETGSAQSQGAVINIGATAVSGTEVFSKIGTYISGSATEVGAGKAAYTFTANSTANSANMSTLTNIENITGTTGSDYMVGDSGANTIDGGAGKDYVTGGTGADIFTFAAGDSGQSSTTADVISDFVTGTDSIDVQSVTLALVAEGTLGVGQAAIAADGTVTFNAADDTVAEQIVAVEAAMTAATANAGETAIFADADNAANSYIFISDGVAGVGANDLLIHILGDAAGALTIASGDVTAIA